MQGHEKVSVWIRKIIQGWEQASLTKDHCYYPLFRTGTVHCVQTQLCCRWRRERHRLSLLTIRSWPQQTTRNHSAAIWASTPRWEKRKWERPGTEGVLGIQWAQKKTLKSFILQLRLLQVMERRTGLLSLPLPAPLLSSFHPPYKTLSKCQNLVYWRVSSSVLMGPNTIYEALKASNVLLSSMQFGLFYQ